MLEMLRVIREQEPPKPSTKLSTAEGLPTLAANRGTEPAKLTKLVRGELDWIVMKALEKDRNRRYETANGFAMDVQRYLADEPVQACPPSAGYRLPQVRPAQPAGGGDGGGRGPGGRAGGGGTGDEHPATRARATGDGKRLQAETQAKDDLENALYFHRIALAHRELSVDNLGRALQFLGECPEDLRGWEWHYLMRLCRVEPLVLRDKTEVNSLAFSSDGEFLASAVGDGAVKVWNSRTGKPIRTLEHAHADSVFSVAFHRDGRHLASVGADRKVKVWDWTTGRNVFTCPSPSGADHNRGTGYGVAFSPDGRHLAAGGDGAVHVWDWENQQPALPPLRGHAKKGISVAFSRGRAAPRLRELERGGHDLGCANRGSPPPLSEHHDPVSALAFSPDGRRLVSAGFDRLLIVWDATTGERLQHLRGGQRPGPRRRRQPGRLAPRLGGRGQDGARLGVGDGPRGARPPRAHRVVSGRGVQPRRPAPRLGRRGRDGPRAGTRPRLRGDEAQEAFTLSQGAGEVWTLAVSPDGRSLASAGLGADSRVKVWDVKSRRGDLRVRAATGVSCSAWPGTPTASGSPPPGGTPSGSCSSSRSGTPAPARSASSCPVGTGDVRRGVQPRRRVPGHGEARMGPCRSGTRGPAGSSASSARTAGRSGGWCSAATVGGWLRRAATGWSSCGTGTRPAWGTSKSLSARSCARVPLAGMTFAFSPDGRRLVAGGEENTVQIWDVQTEQVQILRGHSGDVWATAFSPDPEGRWVASAGEDSTVKVWDTRSGELVHSFRGHTGLVSSVAFSRDGRQLFSGSRDKTVKVWDLTQQDQGPGR